MISRVIITLWTLAFVLCQLATPVRAQTAFSTIIPGTPPGGTGSACTATSYGYLMPLTGGSQVVTCNVTTHLWTAGGGGSTGPTIPSTADLLKGDGAGNGADAGFTPLVVANGTIAYCADAGSTDDYACSLAPVPAGYVTGARYRFKANTANTGAATINFNSLGTKTIVKVAGGVTTTLADNDIRVGQVVDLNYDGTNMQIQSTLGNAPASAITGTQGQLVGIDTSSGSAVAAWVNLCGGQTYVYCPNATLKKIWASNATSATNTDLLYNGSAYTPAAGRRFIAYQGIAATGNTGGTCNWYWRHASVDYRVTATVTPNTIPSQIALSPPIVLEAGDGFRFSCTSTGGAINAWLMGVEYDAVAGSPFSSAIFNTFSAGGNVTLYTVSANKTYNPIIGTINSAVTLGCFNNSGGARTLTSYLVPSGGAAGVTNKMLSATSLGDVSKGNYQTMSMAAAGDFYVLNSDAVTSTQICWMTGYEQ